MMGPLALLAALRMMGPRALLVMLRLLDSLALLVTSELLITLSWKLTVLGDGPFTAPAPWEPPIPAASTHVIACIGADALGYVIADRLHRPLRVAAAAGCSPYDRFTPARAAAALTSTIGMRKNVPAQARFVVAVNAADPSDEQVIELAAELERRECESLVITPAEAGSNR